MSNPWTLLAGAAATVIAALLTLIGVHYGQWLQTRRELATRREQQRHENFHRFADHKRELYAETLAHLDEWHRELKIAFVHVEVWKNDPAIEKLEPWVDWVVAPSIPIQHRQHTYLILARLRLVSLEIWESTRDCVEKLDRFTNKIVKDREFSPIEQFAEIPDALDNLASEMCNDLSKIT
ncbi:hypothetical protein SAMN04488074_12821 [Lentzea albidocapillata subsp. violacea]|uniref:DUF4760 domain-containing protein n=1 Tax=Lentzea albidocapillata subsp. violacea TaxID=128104 RepID=A0A1G9WNV5_9PSEU|nr:hypothetical protein [Lentzea albidocapillata]SDM85881.1 hypothetical protein SAMN04488074_12821 [Lentzea albidocapillata subsp. violacea]